MSDTGAMARLRRWVRSLKGQVMLTLALALFVAQCISAGLLWRGEAEHAAEGLDHVLALRVMLALRRGEGPGAPVLAAPGNGPPPLSTPPLAPPPAMGPPDHTNTAQWLDSFAPQPGDRLDGDAAARLAHMLAGQDVQVARLVVLERPVSADEPSRRKLDDAEHLLKKHHGRPPNRVELAAVQKVAGGRWFVVRAFVPPADPWLGPSLIGQTLLIYLVLVGAMALILRRITRPLAALTGRVDEFAGRPAAQGQLVAQGPDDIRRLIHAHNALEARIVALLDEKNVMLGAIGHDLKTPLAALRVRIECVEDDAERERMAATIEDIVHMLDDILSLARVGRPSDPVEQTELSALVAAVVEEYEDMGEPITLGETHRVVVPARATWVRRALRNLIGNGLRYGHQVRVSVARREIEGKPCAEVCIIDEGAGIPEGDIERMMQPFTRGEPSRNMATGGAGLGLTLARAIADQHGGSLVLANRRDEAGRVVGLAARLTLPARAQLAAPGA